MYESRMRMREDVIFIVLVTTMSQYHVHIISFLTPIFIHTIKTASFLIPGYAMVMHTVLLYGIKHLLAFNYGIQASTRGKLFNTSGLSISGHQFVNSSSSSHVNTREKSGSAITMGDNGLDVDICGRAVRPQFDQDIPSRPNIQSVFARANQK